MSDLTPITREEALLDGQDLEPTTRKEMFIKRIYDDTQEIPEPATREEWFLKKAGEGTSPVTIEALSVTENGTYSEAGKAYSPVTVNVPYDFDKKSLTNQPVASFSDAMNAPLYDLDIDIEPVQDLHGYANPWVGGAGRNLFDMSVWQGTTASGLSFVVNEEFVTINGTKSDGTYVIPNGNFKTLSRGTYYAKAFVIDGTASNAPSVYIYTDSDLTSNIIESEKSFTLESDTSVKFRFAFWSDGATFSDYKVGIVISKTSNINTFQPYANICPISGWTAANVTACGETYTISFGAAGTVYGGYVDVVSGELVVDRAIVDLGSKNWDEDPSRQGVFYTSISDKKTDGSPLSACSGYEVRNVSVTTNYDYYISGVNSYGNGIFVRDTRFAGDSTGFKASVSGITTVYKLESPQTYQLTPEEIKTIFDQQNNIYADTGNVAKVTYLAVASE